ncbi:elongation factor P [Candidatus Viridilinea mediisalina]|uniref:Elongation factor P n=1 Tax=Candidatus Viridilinea mediisalina TaxID=2024553 RepID=A0A2A6RKS9_9CHLR|nr:elongation factor P [Candidatus Viridilinea mediisalina]PDW03652.1 elongation factor P [Candidatus Viridilinea mediisalina]
MAAGTTSDFRNGMVIRYNDDLFQVVEFQHVAPGNWRAFVRVKLKNLRNEKVIEDRFRAGADIDIVRIERRTMQFLYREGVDFVFMDPNTFDQIQVSEAMVGDAAKFLKENDNADLVYDDEREELLSVELPIFVILEVTETTIAVRGDTATNVTKPATLETGAVIQVPGFVNEGDKLKIDTRTGTYIERA